MSYENFVMSDYWWQIGQWDCVERRKFLKDRYSFICQCSGCSQWNLADLLHSGYRCSKPICDGVVLDRSVSKYEKEDINHSKEHDCLQVLCLLFNFFNLNKISKSNILICKASRKMSRFCAFKWKRTTWLSLFGVYAPQG